MIPWTWDKKRTTLLSLKVGGLTLPSNLHKQRPRDSPMGSNTLVILRSVYPVDFSVRRKISEDRLTSTSV